MKLKLICILIIALPLISGAQGKVTKSALVEIITLAKQGETEKAREKIDSLRKQVIEKDSLYLMLLAESSEIYKKEFNCEEVINDTKEIMKIAPQFELDCQLDIARYNAYLGDFDNAFTAYKKVMSLASDEYKIEFKLYNSVANAYNSAERYGDALNILNSNPSKDRIPQEYYNYAIAYLKTNKLDSAKANVDKYLLTEQGINDFSGYHVAAQIYSGIGQKTKACEYAKRAASILSETNSDQYIKSQPKRIQNYYFIKQKLKEIEEAESLKLKLCE